MANMSSETSNQTIWTSTAARCFGRFAVVVVLTLVPPVAARAAVLVDDFEGGPGKGRAGGVYGTFHDDGSTTDPASTIAYAGGHASPQAGTFSYVLGAAVTYP